MQLIIAEGWIKFHNLHSSLNNIKTSKSRRIRWMRHTRYVMHVDMRNAALGRKSVRCGLDSIYPE